tara:strand:- start:1950 stop:2681 length:732 start_codon:yes stop_codon:yes gene_type:complete
MSRTLNSVITETIKRGSYKFCHLVELQWDADDGGSDYLTDAQQDITYGGNTYSSNAFLLGYSDTKESASLETGEINLVLGGADQTYISLILGGAGYIDRKVIIQRLFIPDDFIGSTISSPLTTDTYLTDSVTGGPDTLILQADLIISGLTASFRELILGLSTGDQEDPVAVTTYNGRIMGYAISESPDSTVITLKVANHWADFERINARKTNNVDQKRFFSSDDGFLYCAKMREQEILWGYGV